MSIEVTRTPQQQDLKIISEGIQTYNREHIGEVAVEEDFKFAVFARNDQGEVIGGIRAVAYWNWLQIELLWLKREARGAGIGIKLLDSAEAFAMENDFFLSRLETTSFQALGFYEKQGYEVFGQLNDFPEGQTTYFLKKALCRKNIS